MLPEIQLDNSRFEDMAAEAGNTISSYFPQWTDRNAHDPGITLIELFAWMKEVQEYHLNQIGPAHLRKYLKLLGVNVLKRTPSSVILEAKGEAKFKIFEGSKCYADTVCFETEEEMMAGGQSVTAWLMESPQGIVTADERQLAYDGKFRLPPFGMNPVSGCSCYLKLKRPLEEREDIHLLVGIYDSYPVRRNPVEKADAQFLPLGEIAWEFFGKNGWQELEVIQDETKGLLQSGFVKIRQNGKMEETSVNGQNGYFVRLFLKKSWYETPPVITGLSFNKFRALQKETRSIWRDIPARFEQDGTVRFHWNHCLSKTGITEIYACKNQTYRCVKEFLSYEKEGNLWYEIKKEAVLRLSDAGKMPESFRVLCFEPDFEKERTLENGNGFPDQFYELPESGVLEDSFQLMIEKIGEPGSYETWQRVEDFDASSPEDLHYVLDGENGTVLFGNGINGLPPEGRIFISGFCVSEGGNGNIKAGKIRAFEKDAGMLLDNGEDAAGGKDREELGECFYRFLRELKKRTQAVTCEDFEELVLKTPGLMIDSCKAVAMAEVAPEKYMDLDIGIIVKPYSPSGFAVLNRIYEKNILTYLEQKRLLGTRLRLYSPEYIEITVYIEVSVYPQYRQSREMITQAIREWLAKQSGNFGEILSYGKLYGTADSVECVKKILNLAVDARGNRIIRNPNGDVIPPHNGVFLLREVVCTAVIE